MGMASCFCSKCPFRYAPFYLSSPSLLSSLCINSPSIKLINHNRDSTYPRFGTKPVLGFIHLPPSSLPRTEESDRESCKDDEDGFIHGDDKGRGTKQEWNEMEFDKVQLRGVATAIEETISEENFGVIAACVVGLVTGLGVVLFNNADLASWKMIGRGRMVDGLYMLENKASLVVIESKSLSSKS